MSVIFDRKEDTTTTFFELSHYITVMTHNSVSLALVLFVGLLPWL